MRVLRESAQNGWAFDLTLPLLEHVDLKVLNAFFVFVAIVVRVLGELHSHSHR